MASLVSCNAQLLRRLFLDGIRVLDVRAPIEFTVGSFSNAVNLPIMDDLDRELIGTCYKNHGKDAALSLGFRRVSGAVKDERVCAWKHFFSENPQSLLFCFRGGQRSAIACNWLKEVGINVPRVEGGYKAIRNALLPHLSPCKDDIVVIGGKTGSGKTAFLIEDSNAIDLEGCANHRGSSFGMTISPQPAQTTFENTVAIEFLKRQPPQGGIILLEDEGNSIGKVGIPPGIRQATRSAAVIILEEEFDKRVDRIFEEYVVQQLAGFVSIHGDDSIAGFDAFGKYLLGAIERLSKRLGGARYQEFCKLMQDALLMQEKRNDLSGHRVWIELLLRDYYDPMYTFQLEKKSDRIAYCGDAASVREWLNDKRNIRALTSNNNNV